MRHIRTLCAALKAPILLTDIHVRTGALMVGTNRNLLVFSINGRLVGISEHCVSHGDVVRVDVPQITCATYSVGDDWDEDTLYVTGHVDGSIRFCRSTNPRPQPP